MFWEDSFKSKVSQDTGVQECKIKTIRKDIQKVKLQNKKKKERKKERKKKLNNIQSAQKYTVIKIQTSAEVGINRCISPQALTCLRLSHLKIWIT